MKVLFWNVRGIKKASARIALLKIVRENSPDIICLDEPMVSMNKFPKSFFSKIGFATDFIQNERVDAHPNLWIMWKQGLRKPLISSMSEQKLSIQVEWNDRMLNVSMVHAKCLRAERRSLWMDIVFDDSGAPRMIIGDFNATLYDHERRGPGSFSLGAAYEFAAMVDALALIQIPSSGRKFTWTNNRRRGNVAAVLDRTFVNEEWMKIFDDCIQKVLICVASDHAPLMACSVSSIKPKNCPFRLNSFWMDHHQFLDLIKEVWHNNFSGSSPFILAQKLKALKLVIKSWSREAFPNLDQEVITSKAKLENIQRSIEEDGLTEQLFDQEVDAKTKYWKAMENQEKLWLQKSRVRWLKEGDRCSRFFHVMTRIKRSKNTIRCITTEDGVDISARDQMGSYLAEYYETFHKKVDLEDHPQIFNCIPRILQNSDQVMLDAIPSEEEIKRAVWDLDPDISLGPDGFTGAFFRKCWDIIHDDVYRAVKGFFFIRYSSSWY
ncbi:uncharacterized protein LOC122059150 [Macadamia integrifolia]|uniref:uncharacterized protein LOC122059150 n=1 Tax=Macadamia integrifolia TaxID=60698 RepID=UPI001C528CB8|nr:uncharacterized protein LOC122059150 [Macadamia integrifolia]